ncbi:MAG: hypothetical protein NVS4B3_19770 [Gemmatimonadaceae bacterium]
MRNATLGLALLAVAAGCGGRSATAPAVARNNPGTGTSTLMVSALVDAVNVAGGFSTDYTVTVQDRLGAAVSGATVTINNPTAGPLTLPETAPGSGVYFNTKLSFPSGDFRLDVVRGTDNVAGVIVGGPSPHVITTPTNGSVVPANQPLLVRWTVPSISKAATVETRNFAPIVLADTGAYVIAAANNPVNSNQRVRVTRYNEVDMNGGLPGSRLRVVVENTAEPINVR